MIMSNNKHIQEIKNSPKYIIEAIGANSRCKLAFRTTTSGKLKSSLQPKILEKPSNRRRRSEFRETMLSFFRH